MKPHGWRRLSLLAVALAAGLVWCSADAPAAVDLSVGIRYVSPQGSISDCGAKAKSSLDAFLRGAAESSPGSGEWLAFTSNGVAGTPTGAATVRCYALSKGYVVTFTCVVQLPDNPYGSDALCLDVAHKFYGGAITALAPIPTPTPIPTGCATTNLVGTWVSDDKPSLTFTMDLTGNVTDSDGVSGNWGLKGTTVTFTYYGNHTLTLSSDGKHMRGGGYSLTRKC
ncbi:MAG TPA: hypothetical protein VN909_07740 [Candidatus Dormibacteraeota bacterium]|nr:hypothetical protein [Candidatus Dormibacteraeota bacterium]